MKILLALLILFGAGGYYIYTIRQENAKMKEQMDKMAESLPEEERARLYGAKPLLEERLPGATGRMVHKRVVCPQCKGEGAVMVRRTVNASVTDVKTMCALCMGAGKREFDMPSKSEICPDCGGMGKRAIYSAAARQGHRLGNASLDANDIRSGFQQQAPTSTSCPRCLGRGAIERPGLR